MKRISISILALTLIFALCACAVPSVPAATPAAPAPAPARPAQAPAAVPAGAEVIRDGVFYYETAELSGDYGDGLSPVEGARLADEFLVSGGFYSAYGEIAAGHCFYITLDELAFVDSFDGNECYIYTVGVGTVEGGLDGGDYLTIYRVAVDYSGSKTAALYEDFGNLADSSEYDGRWINEGDGFQLDIKNGHYTLIENATLSIWAGSLGQDADKLTLGEYSARMDGESLLIDGIGGAFEYQLVYDGGADERFLGEWENDTTDYKLNIDETDCVFSRLSEMSMSMSSYAADGDALVIGENEMVTLTGDGGLHADGYEGTFYRVGEGRGAPSPFIEYLGSWSNEETGQSLDIQEGAYFMADASDDGFGMGMGGIVINEDGSLAIGADKTATLNADGTLSVTDIDGVFQKTGEYTPPEASLAPAPEPAPQAEPAGAREYPDMRYGVIETSPAVFLEPETGTRVVFPEAFAPNVFSAMEIEYGIAYMLAQSPDAAEDFSLFGSEITAMGYVSYENIGAESIEDVIRHLVGNVGQMRIIDQTLNYVEYYELSGDYAANESFKWAYLYDDGSVLCVSFTADASEVEELAYEISVELGAVSGQGGAAPAPDGPVGASEDDDAVGLGAAIGAWYCEELDAAFIFEPDRSAVLIGDGQIFEGTFNVYYAGDIFDSWRVEYVTEDSFWEAQLYGGMLLLDDVDTHVFSRVSPSDLPESIQALIAE